MTVVELRAPSPRQRWVSAEERRAAAREHYLAAVAAGEEPTGDDIGPLFDRSARWGRERIEEAKASAATAATGDDQAAVVRVRAPWYCIVALVVVGVLAAAASYGHMSELARTAGEPEWIALTVPLTVDGLVLAALWARERGRWWLGGALVVSMAANMTAADPTLIGYLVAGWPPLALFGTHRLLYG